MDNERNTTLEFEQQATMKAIEALTDPEKYKRNLTTGRPHFAEGSSIHQDLWPLSTTQKAAILGFYDKPNFLTPNKPEFQRHEAIDIFVPAGTSVICPADGYVVNIERYDQLRPGFFIPQSHFVDVYVYTNQGLLYGLVHLEKSSLAPELLDKKLNFNEEPIPIRAGQKIGEVGKWHQSLERIKESGVVFPEAVVQHYQTYGQELTGSHLHLAVSDFTYLQKDRPEGMDGAKLDIRSTKSFTRIIDERAFNPLHVMPELFKNG